MKTMMKLRDVHPAKALDIRVIGVGGAGCSSLSRLAGSVSSKLALLAIDTGSAAQNLHRPGQVDALSLGNGFGSGGDAESAIAQFLQTEAHVSHFVSGADVVIILAGLGRGTGSGISPRIAEISRESGALTIAAVNMPFEFEGRFRSQSANDSLDRLMESADLVIARRNDDLSKLGNTGISLKNAFQAAGESMVETVHAISRVLGDSIERFEAVTRSLRNSGSSAVLSGTASGLHAGNVAVAHAFDGASMVISDVKTAVIHVEGGIGLSLGQVAEAVTAVRTRIGRQAEVHVISERNAALGQDIKVTLVLAGVGQRSDPLARMTPLVENTDRNSIPSVSIFDTADATRTSNPMLLPAG
jgi:cell division protein FtsZ